MDPEQMRQAMLALMSELSAKDEQLRDKAVELERSQREAAFKQTLIDKLTHEMAVLKRLKFAATSREVQGRPECRAEEPAGRDPRWRHR